MLKKHGVDDIMYSMNINKKRKIIFSLLLSISFTFILWGTVFIGKAFADTPARLDTKFYLPSSPVEFYELNNPTSVSYTYENGKHYYAISQYATEKKSDDTTVVTENSIVVFDGEKYVKLEGATIDNVKNAVIKNGYLFYLYDSNIYYLPLDDLSATPVNTNVFTSNFFSVSGNTFLINTTSYLKIYNLDFSGGAPAFTKTSFELATTSVNGHIDESGNVYYLTDKNPNTLKCRQATNSVDYDIMRISSISGMAALGDYVYYTTATVKDNDGNTLVQGGLYKVKKGENQSAELLIPANENASTLGNLKSPQGIAVKSGKILITDSALNCVQEYDPSTRGFTDFAITTEATAEYRLTKKSDKIFLSKNYLYVLDNAAASDASLSPRKRLVKISVTGEKNYSAIDLSEVYSVNPEAEISSFCASDDYVLIYDGKSQKARLYRQNGKTLVYAGVEQEGSITAATYLDGNFYFTVYGQNEDHTKDLTNLFRITVPSEDNELSEPKLEEISHGKIEGKTAFMTVDVFGYVYMLTHSTSSESDGYALTRFYNDGYTVKGITVSDAPLAISADFSGNVFLLTKDNAVTKYSPDGGTFDDGVKFRVDLKSGDKVKDFALNYSSEGVYYLSDACVLKNADDSLGIVSLAKISAKSVNKQAVLSDVKFLTVKKDAKMFKVDLNDLETDGDEIYFRSIDPKTELNVRKTYLIIADIDDKYYLVSYSEKFVALVRKTSVSSVYGPTSDATLITPDDYDIYGISVENASGGFYLSNDVMLSAKPIFSGDYKVPYGSVSKGDKVFAEKTVSFNGKSMTLISLTEGGAPVGYVPSGFLTPYNDYVTPALIENTQTIGGNAKKRVTDALMIILIGFTVTFAALFIERRLLFDAGQE